MADSKISALPASTVPLAGTEVLPIVQGGSTKQVSVQNVLSSVQPTGTANSVAYLNGSKVLTTGTALKFDGTNLGLGVTPSVWWANSKAFELGGSANGYIAFNSPATSAGGYIYANAHYNGTNNLYKNDGFAAQYAINPGDGSHRWYTAVSGTAGNTIPFSQILTLLTSGNLGIGSTSPGSKLDIVSAQSGVALRTMVGSTVFFSVSNNSNGSIVDFNDNTGAVKTRIDARAGFPTFFTAGSLAVGTATPNASAIFEAASTTQGVRMPNMTTTQKNAIATPAAGLIVFDTTLAKLCVYSGAAWQTITSV